MPFFIDPSALDRYDLSQASQSDLLRLAKFIREKENPNFVVDPNWDRDTLERKIYYQIINVVAYAASFGA